MKVRLVTILFIIAAITVNTFAQSVDVFKRKNIEARMLSVAKWQLANPKHKLYDWTNGAFYAGIFAAWETTKSPELMKAMLEMGEANEWKACLLYTSFSTLGDMRCGRVFGKHLAKIRISRP